MKLENLDKRIIEGKKPLTVFDVDLAIAFEGQEGYFSDYSGDFKNLKRASQGCLKEVEKSADADYPFFCGNEETYYRFFLPAEWVKEPEKKYRPFTNEEFLALFDSGKLHSIRKKNEKGRYIITDVYFNDDCEEDTVFVCLNNCGAGTGMRYLVDNDYEYFDGEDWQPFGVKD
jgi:hypothetical protein